MTDLADPSILDLSRYSRQMLVSEIGESGQRRLLASRVTLVGCGALGTALANTLVRAGVGCLRLCDRDYIELNNLQRQILFDEQDIADGLPKAEAAARKLRRINSSVRIDAVVADVNYSNIERHGDGADLLLDGTDNFETRYLINDLAVKTDRPWVYGAVVGTTGLVMPIIPGRTPCLRCVFPDAPPPELNPTCDTAGVLSSAVNLVAAFQALETIKILIGRTDALVKGLVSIDAWTGRVVILDVHSAANRADCPCCGKRRFVHLDGTMSSGATSLCGRNAVQINPAGASRVDLALIADKLRQVAHGAVLCNEHMVRAGVGAYELTVFPDGRAIIKGTHDPDAARTIYAKYVGA
ncbi:MAG: thiazole biosynthesis adenylyltransferase ThiF [Phycisphaerales bacterium]|nr:thiazole biosynthesis adenylyltransferase ThiF [Phycisphaerales bacterium]